MSPDARSIEFQTENGVRLHAIEWTEKNSSAAGRPPLILLHGGGANAHWWDHLAPSFTALNPVYALDFRGHGDSAYPNEHYVGAFSDDLEALLSHIDRRDVVLVGHSLGAAVALDHATRFPQTKGLALVDLARGSGGSGRRRTRLALSLRRNYRTREEAIERFRFFPESTYATEELRHAVATNSVMEDPDGRFGYKFDPAWFGLPSKPRPDLDKLNCPTLLVRGAESALLSADAAREFLSLIPTGEFAEIPRAGHHVLIDQPLALASELDRFLKSVQ